MKSRIVVILYLSFMLIAASCIIADSSTPLFWEKFVLSLLIQVFIIGFVAALVRPKKQPSTKKFTSTPEVRKFLTKVLEESQN